LTVVADFRAPPTISSGWQCCASIWRTLSSKNRDPCVGVLRTARVQLMDTCGREDGAQVVPGQLPELIEKKAAALLGNDRIRFAIAP
jgi:hypothetical protein